MSGDQEIREQLLAWSTLASIAQKHLASEISGGGCDGVVGDAEEVESRERLGRAGEPDGTLRKNNGAQNQAALFGGTTEGGTS
jgi:hypothetical protein